ncbi:Relaxosome protein (plasmid) [Variovorax sp. SRS16]|uniref:plasmid mobilization protein n=1 Tax=Variovorax sp. SRS16 TaxID=282217 RepID=UPI0013172A6A|nr:conjugal transfer protein TrbJ [Variovorax sp. SRS16]VTU46113.1 Relaxosome protein [Variovorax sp. SRS16]
MNEDAGTAPRATRKGSTALNVYCLPEEHQAIHVRAAQSGLSTSAYLRQLGLGYQPKSVYDLDQVEVLARVNADQARLGNLLKMWLADDARLKRFDEAQMRATIVLAMERIQACQAALLDAAKKA